MSGIKFEQLPIRCRYCNYLQRWSIYMNGNADYSCRKYNCTYRIKFKEAIQNERKEKR